MQQNFLKISISTLLVFLATFYPLSNQVPQLLTRLFPFKRGLCHAYWAPNVWALYSFLDRIAIKCKFKLLNYFFNFLVLNVQSAKGSSTRGLVGDIDFKVLPEIKPYVTMILTFLFQIVMKKLIAP